MVCLYCSKVSCKENPSRPCLAKLRWEAELCKDNTCHHTGHTRNKNCLVWQFRQKTRTEQEAELRKFREEKRELEGEKSICQPEAKEKIDREFELAKAREREKFLMLFNQAFDLPDSTIEEIEERIAAFQEIADTYSTATDLQKQILEEEKVDKDSITGLNT